MIDLKKPRASRARKPTHASVTSVPCKCRYLERAAEEPTSPIVFDERMNEFHIRNVGKDRRGHSMIYHCPFCGGAAPRSKRASFFAKITAAETERLHALAEGLTSFHAVKARFGKPDVELEAGLRIHRPGSDTEAPTVQSYPTLTYTQLSKTAELHFTDYGPERGVRVTLQGKYQHDGS